MVSCLTMCLAPAMAAPCPGNPNALGTARTITVEQSAFPRIGTVQYRNTLPLNDREVVITFDDGPLPPYTTRVLDALARECVQATFFLVGRMATAHPELVRRIYNAGHVIGTHSQNHPLTFDQMELPRVEREVNAGIASVQAAAGNPKAVAPFFRIPGLARTRQVEAYLASKSLSVWSADEVADDWFRDVTAADIVRKAIERIESRGRGVLLLHDIHPATAMAVPVLLRELKKRGFKVVHAIPAGERPRSVPELDTPVADSGSWPRVVKASAPAVTQTATLPRLPAARPDAAQPQVATRTTTVSAARKQPYPTRTTTTHTTNRKTATAAPGRPQIVVQRRTWTTNWPRQTRYTYWR